MIYPVNLKIDDMNIVIIGGGNVSYRKCLNFLVFNKKIKVVSEEFIEEFDKIKENIEMIKGSYDKKYIEEAFLVVAATNDKNINYEIGNYCTKHNKLVNVVDNYELSTFTMPSFIKRGDLLLSISTGGKSPCLSKKIRKDLEKIYDESYEGYVNLLGEARKKIIENTSDIKDRREKIQRLLELSLDELKEKR